MKTDGFTLIEITVVLAIIALLLGALLTPLTTQTDKLMTDETRQSLSDIREALIGFAMINGYLPCPAISASNGFEDRTSSACTGGKRTGFLPWKTIGGVPANGLDAWGHLFRYSVTPAFASSNPLFSLTSSPDITILTRNGSTLVCLTNSSAIPAVVFSYGKNGYGATNAQGVSQNPGASVSADENTNIATSGAFPGCSSPAEAAVNGTLFFFREPAPSSYGTFDDILTWIPVNILMNRMVLAGKLP